MFIDVAKSFRTKKDEKPDGPKIELLQAKNEEESISSVYNSFKTVKTNKGMNNEINTSQQKY